MSNPALPLLSRALIGVSLALVAYVAYAHVASIAARRSPDLDSRVTLLSSEDALRDDLLLRSEGAIDHHFVGGNLVVSAAATSAGAARPSLLLLRSESRLTDVAIRVRYRSHGAARVFVGLAGERAGSPSDLRFAIGEDGRAVLSGDGRDSGARHEVASEGRPAGGTGDDAGEGSDWHELSLHVSPQLGSALGSVDGAPVAWSSIGWKAGARVRIEAGVERGDGDGAMSVELARFSDERLPSDGQPESFTDGFHGHEVDPARWSVRLPESSQAEARAHVLPAGGLEVETTATHARSFLSGFALDSRPMLLASFRLEALVRVRRLHAAAVYVVVGTLDGAYAARRIFQGGLIEGSDGRPTPFAAGHWTHDAQHSYELLHAVAEAGGQDAGAADAGDVATSRIGLAYDAHTGVGRVSFDGVTLFERPVDLRPLDNVSFGVAVDLSQQGAQADFVVEEIRLVSP